MSVGETPSELTRRQVEQPGAPLSPRRVCIRAEAGPQLRLRLPGGADLLAELAKVLSARGIESAALQVLAGGFRKVSYFTGMIDPSGARVATYGEPRELEGPITLLGANAIYGSGEDGAPLVHCHAVMTDLSGVVHGGHLPPTGCILDGEGAVAMVSPLQGAGFRVSFDSETNYSLFQPAASEVTP